MSNPGIITIDTADIAAMLGCGRRHATNVITKRPDFPKPVVNLSQRIRRWPQVDVLNWIERRSRA
jgi:predicted DNA-binding transcriptional regulator AlpA